MKIAISVKHGDDVYTSDFEEIIMISWIINATLEVIRVVVKNRSNINLYYSKG
jgi:hypothetical protein